MIRHDAGDLTAVVSAETPLDELQRELAGHGQMLALDPPGAATIGAAVTSNASGPLRHRYGSARDLVLGVQVRLPDGTVARAGGRVIKNVAGYDLAKLYVGSEGTLGELLELSLRLHPLPRATATAIGCSEDPAALAAAAMDLSHRPLELQSLDVRWADGSGAILARVGRAEPLEPAREIAAALADHGLSAEVVEDDEGEWARQREWQRSPERVMVRVSGLQTQLRDVLGLGHRVVGRAGLGLSWVEVADAAELEELRAAVAPSPCVVLDCPDGLELDRHGPMDPGALELMRRVRERFA